MLAPMTGKFVVITGGAAGIGRASAMAFAREGASVIIGDIDGAGAEETVSRIREGGGKATSVRTDVTNSADVRRTTRNSPSSPRRTRPRKNGTRPSPSI